MKIEVYDPKGNLIREIDCDGPEQDWDMDEYNAIEPSGRCKGCSMEPNWEKVECYKKGSRIWFVDPADLMINRGYTLHDFTVEETKLRRDTKNGNT